MSEAVGAILIRVLRGEESLGVAFVMTLLMMGIYFAYEAYVPSLSGVFDPFYRFFRVFILTYTLVSIHNCCRESSFFPRMLARFYVLALVAAAALNMYAFYGPAWGVAYPLIALAAVFVLGD